MIPPSKQHGDHACDLPFPSSNPASWPKADCSSLTAVFLLDLHRPLDYQAPGPTTREERRARHPGTVR